MRASTTRTASIALAGALFALAFIPLSTATTEGGSPRERLLSFVLAAQASDGSFRSPTPTDTGSFLTPLCIGAISAAGVDPRTTRSAPGQPSARDWLRDHLALYDASKATEWEKQIIAIAGTYDDPTSFGGVNYVTQLRLQFINGQMGSPGQYNDDIFGLLAFSAGNYPTTSPESQGMLANLRAWQRADGGWGFGPNAASDVDLTGAGIAALATMGVPSSDTAVQRALSFLHARQTNAGGFSLDSQPNLQTTAWVLWGLKSVGEDPTSAAWTKNGNTAISWIEGRIDTDGTPLRWDGSRADLWAACDILYGLAADRQPNAAYVASSPRLATTTPRAGETVSFEDAAGPARVAWDFGDGSTGTGDPASHTYAVSGDYAVTATARSGTYGKNVTRLAVHVLAALPVNHAPLLAPVADAVVNEGATLGFQLSATDEDGDAVTFSASPLPAGATLGSSTGALAWTPSYQQAGSYSINFTASDGKTSTSQVASITVANVNTVPVVDAIPNRTVTEGQLLRFQVNATDADGDTLAFSATSVPPGSSFSPSNRSFWWTPGFGEVGVFPLAFNVTDSVHIASARTNVSVVSANRTPVILPITNVTVVELASAKSDIRASSPSNETIVLSASGLPSFASFRDFGNGTGSITWNATLGTTGAYAATVTATVAGTFTSSRAANATVLQASNLTIVRAGVAGFAVAPNSTVTVNATLTNTGPEVDTFRLVPSATSNWRVENLTNVTLAPNSSRVIALNVTAPMNALTASVRIDASSLGNPNVKAAVAWTLSAPATARIEYDRMPFSPLDRVSGNVTVTFVDGSPARSSTVRVTQFPRNATGLQTAVSGSTNASGAWRFDFGIDERASLVGWHDVLVTVNHFTTTQTVSAYEVDIVPPVVEESENATLLVDAPRSASSAPNVSTTLNGEGPLERTAGETPDLGSVPTPQAVAFSTSQSGEPATSVQAGAEAQREIPLPGALGFVMALGLAVSLTTNRPNAIADLHPRGSGTEMRCGRLRPTLRLCGLRRSIRWSRAR